MIRLTHLVRLPMRAALAFAVTYANQGVVIIQGEDTQCMKPVQALTHARATRSASIGIEFVLLDFLK